MKKLTIIFYLFLIPLCVFAQNESSISHTKTVNDGKSTQSSPLNSQ